MRTFSGVVLSCCLTVLGASIASASLVTTESGLYATDTYHWASYGEAPVPNGTTLTTQAGVAFSASNPDNSLVVEAPGAFGDPGDATTDILLSDIQSPQTISISFGTAIADV